MSTNPYESPHEPLTGNGRRADADRQKRSRRPWGVTLIAWFSILNSIRHAGVTLQAEWIDTDVKVEALVTDGFSLLIGIGLLGMRKWAVVLYFALYAVNMLRIVPRVDADSLLKLLQSAAVLPLAIVPVATLVFVVPHWLRMKWL